MNSDPANEILPGLWLGNVNASKDAQFIQSKNIKAIFNCTKNLPFSVDVPYKYRVPVDDNLEREEIRNMALWAPEIALKIMRHMKNGDAILVHCMAGMQRSAASVAIFLILDKHMTVDQAIKFVQSKRPIAFHVQANFLPAIESFYQQFQLEILPAIEKKTVRFSTL